jgi:predicted alpha/beta-hydrolase family hydrolase
MTVQNEQRSIEAGKSIGSVSALLTVPEAARALLVFGHGAGAPMTHVFMETMSDELAARGIGSLRYNFPYMERGRRAPDRQHVLVQTVRSAVDYASSLELEIPILAGGKSMGGRMTSLAQAEVALPGVAGLGFFGFPLHAPGKDSADRGQHLREIELPMFFLQGSRDRLARLDLIRPLIDDLHDAILYVVEDGDHSFKVPKRTGRSYEEILADIATQVESWVSRRIL